MRDIVLSCAMLLSFIATVYCTISFFKTFHSMPEEAGTGLRRAAMIVCLVIVGLLTAMTVVCLVLLAGYIGKELVIFFAAAYFIACLILYFAARNCRYPGTLGNVHKRIQIEIVVYASEFLIIFGIFMYGVFTAT